MRTTRAIGLHIAGGEFRAAEVEHTPQGKELLSFLSKPFSDEKELSLFLRQLREKTSGEEVIVVSAPYDETVIRHLHVPFKERKKISRMIKYEVKPRIPFAIEETIVDFYDSQTEEGEGADLIVAAMREGVARERLALLKDAGLSAQIMDIENLAQLASYLYSGSFVPRGRVLLIDISSRRSLVGIVEGEKLIFTRTIHRKKDYTKEIEITLASFLEKRKGIVLEKAVISGDAEEAEVALLQKQLKEKFKLESEEFSFAQRVNDARGLLEKAGGEKKYVIPLGLALRGLEEKRIGINLLGEEGIRAMRLRRLRKSLASSTVLAGLLVLALFINVLGKAVKARKTLAEYETEIRNVFTAAVPGVTSIINEEAQLEKTLEALKEKSAVLSRFAKTTPDSLEVFRELSLRINPRVKVQLSELIIDKDKITLVGVAPSLAVVNGLKRELSVSQYFQDIQVPLSRSDAAGEAFDFRLTMKIVSGRSR